MSDKAQDIVGTQIGVLFLKKRSIKSVPLGHLRYRIRATTFPQISSDLGPGQPCIGVAQDVAYRL
jgi:hypothetical protein